MCVLISYTTLSEKFPSLRRTERDMIINVFRLFSSDFDEPWIFDKYSNVKINSLTSNDVTLSPLKLKSPVKKSRQAALRAGGEGGGG
jgi:outer membrane lipoprotein-sorting protein